MKTAAPPTKNTALAEQFIQDMEQLALLQQAPIAALKLSAYAADAMRVLMVLERHADMSNAFDGMLKTVCPDWRNPGSMGQPADLIADVLFHAIATLQRAQEEMERITASMREA